MRWNQLKMIGLALSNMAARWCRNKPSTLYMPMVAFQFFKHHLKWVMKRSFWSPNITREMEKITCIVFRSGIKVSKLSARALHSFSSHGEPLQTFNNRKQMTECSKRLVKGISTSAAGIKQLQTSNTVFHVKDRKTHMDYCFFLLNACLNHYVSILSYKKFYLRFWVISFILYCMTC